MSRKRKGAPVVITRKDKKLNKTGRLLADKGLMPACSKETKIAAVLAAAPLIALGAGQAAHASTTYGAGSCTARGSYATCVASGNATRPSTIYVHVRANRSQRLKVYWTVVCTQGTGAGTRSGSFSPWVRQGQPISHKITHPYTHPSSCTVASTTQLNTGFALRIWNTYHRW